MPHTTIGVWDSFVYEITVGEDNRIWVGWRDGMSVYDHSSWRTYNYLDMGLPSSTNVGDIVIDGDGNTWINCTTRFDGTNWFTYTSKELAIQNNFNAILHTVDKDVHCWLADPDRGRVCAEQVDRRQGIKYYNGGSWTTVNNATMGISGSGMYAYLEGWDRAGNLWVKIADQFDHGGLSCFDGLSWTAYRAINGVIEPPAGMSVEHSGRVWFGAFKGFSIHSNIYQGQKRTIYPTRSKSILSIDGSTTVNFPSGAVDLTTTLTYTTTVPSPTGDLLGIDHFFAMSAVISGTTTPVTSFNEPYTVTVEYRQSETGAVDESTLGLYWWDGDEWQAAASTCDPLDNQVTAVLGHLTKFAVLGEAQRIYLPLVIN